MIYYLRSCLRTLYLQVLLGKLKNEVPGVQLLLLRFGTLRHKGSCPSAGHSDGGFLVLPHINYTGVVLPSASQDELRYST